ncbi:hypothetical protein GQ607_015676 [Colletotrichum asianum]|uniref:Uncharacterized protein n=1 Tax=Colletotrichum asianum TaxID=702518 RepID=A0A8H3VY51_9PEZI|nr:hypothetical protein GQ607_015676 [Colletotrichum asianum]
MPTSPPSIGSESGEIAYFKSLDPHGQYCFVVSKMEQLLALRPHMKKQADDLSRNLVNTVMVQAENVVLHRDSEMHGKDAAKP